MRPQRQIPEEDVKRLKQGLKKAKTVPEYRHTHVLYLRGAHAHTNEEIARITQYSVQRVASIIGGYFKHGLDILKNFSKPKPRKWGNMTLDQEKAFISEYLDKAKRGEVIEVSNIKKEYERRIGRETAPSVIYNILHRHDWRKIAPRPAHPKKDPEKAEAFKKTSLN